MSFAQSDYVRISVWSETKYIHGQERSFRLMVCASMSTDGEVVGSTVGG